MGYAPHLRVCLSPLLCVTVTALLWPRFAFSALPPSATESAAPSQPAPQTSPGVTPSGTPAGGGGTAQSETNWILPAIRWGGSLTYEVRKDSENERKVMHRGLMATLNAATETYIWQPWFAQLKGNLGLTADNVGTSRNEMAGSFNRSTSKNLVVTGIGQLTVLQQSKFPFEAHIERSDSRVTTDQASANGYSSTRAGFSQRYVRQQGDTMFSWDRATQNSDSSGISRQDTLQLGLSHSLESHRFQLNGNRTDNTHERTGESVVQNNLTLQHSYTPDSTVQVENMVNAGSSAYHLQYGDNDTRISQLSSMMFWRPLERPMTITGGVRLLTLSANTISGLDNGMQSNARVRNANANLGLSYELNKHLRFNAATSVNQNAGNTTNTSSTSETASLTYQPDAKLIRGFQYNWSTSASGGNHSGTQESGRQLTLQMTHSLSRTFNLSESSAISAEVGQTLGATERAGKTIENGLVKQLTHSGSLSWSMNGNSSTSMIRFSASDSRSIGDSNEFFQLINLQMSSNVPTGGYSSWSGNLTLQGIRQGGTTLSGLSYGGYMGAAQQGGFVTTSTGSITYQHQRAFGVRGLRFVSDLRLNNHALLPMLGSPRDLETSAWENRFYYLIGRTQLRMSILLAKTQGFQQYPTNQFSGATNESGQRLNKSIMFTVTRSFGEL